MTAKGFKKEQREPWLTPEDIEEFKARRMTIKDLAKKYWERPYIIKKWLREAGVQSIGRSIKVNKLTEQDIQDYKELRIGVPSLAEKYSVSKPIIYRWLHDLGLTNPQGKRPPSKPQLTSKDIKDYKSRKTTIEKLSRDHQVAIATMRKWLIRSGVEINSQGIPSLDKRNSRLIEMLKTHPLGEVARKFKVSRQRAHQLFKEHCGVNLRSIRKFGRPKESE